MIAPIKRNLGHAIGQVFWSVAGSLGVVFLVSAVIAAEQVDMLIGPTFFGYYSGGQLGLAALSVSGLITLAITNHGRLHYLLSIIVYTTLLGSVITIAIIIGGNPGFSPGRLNITSLSIIWFCYAALHLLWFLILLFEPNVPSAQETGDAQERRINKILGGDSRHE